MTNIAILVFSIFYLAFCSSPLKAGWRLSARPAANHNLNIMLVLNIENEAELDRQVAAVSEPSSPSYTNYLTFEEIIQKFAPAPQTLQQVKQWLIQNGVTENSIRVTPTRDFITFSCTVEQGESLFAVQFATFVHPQLGSVVRSLEKYTLPAHLRSHIAIVSGVTNFPSSFRVQTSGGASKKRQDEVDPQFIWKAFNTGGVTGTNSKNLQACAQFLGQYFDPADLASFQQAFNLKAQPIAKVIGPNDPTNPGDEASLDVEYITGTAPGVPTWFFSTGGEHEGQERFLVWAQTLNTLPILPYVHSVSYGDYENTIDLAYADRLEVEFKKLAARGITVLFSSGDNGVGCTSNCVNVPNWPAESTMVTAVGGFNPDFTADSISSGGFSNYFAQAAWQKTAVSTYLKGNGLPPARQFNASGRGVPDVSAFSENVIIVSGGSQEPVGGTSCASPTFAGIVSLINDALLNAGKRPVGYLNPALYSIAATTPKAFIDITSGPNNGYGCCNGFSPAPGWDPITGLGGPNFPVLRDAFKTFQENK